MITINTWYARVNRLFRYFAFTIKLILLNNKENIDPSIQRRQQCKSNLSRFNGNVKIPWMTLRMWHSSTTFELYYDWNFFIWVWSASSFITNLNLAISACFSIFDISALLNWRKNFCSKKMNLTVVTHCDLGWNFYDIYKLYLSRDKIVGVKSRHSLLALSHVMCGIKEHINCWSHRIRCSHTSTLESTLVSPNE